MTKTMVDGKNSITILGIFGEVKKIIQKCKVPLLSCISFTPFDVRNQQVVSTNNGNKVVHLLCRRENMEVVPFQSFSCCRCCLDFGTTHENAISYERKVPA